MQTLSGRNLPTERARELFKSSKAGFLNLWATEEFLKGNSLVLLKLNKFCKMNLRR